MKFFSNHKKAAVAGLALTVAIVGGGVAFAYWTSSGSGTGSASDATATPLTISQDGTPAYDSLVSPMPPDTWNEAFSELNTSFGPSSVGNAITLASPGTTLSSVVVALDNWACQTGNGNGPGAASCVTTNPSATYPATMTLNVYNPSNLTSAIASDTQTFNIPFRPSGNAAHCSTGNTWAGSPYENDGSQWYDAATNTCNYGQTSTVTFNSFGGAVLPSNVVYKISYTPNSTSITDPSNYLNFNLSTESTGISIGSDTDPGNLYMGLLTDGSGAAAAGPSGQVSCTPAVAGFVEYSTAAGTGCGLGATFNIPAVEFNVSTASGLYPGGPALPINFSVTNPGSIPAALNTVTIAITTITNQHGTSGGACDPAWFTVTQPTVINGSVAAGATWDDTSSGASIQLNNSSTIDEDACQGATVNLKFTSN
jgi:hypothetical protein